MSTIKASNIQNGSSASVNIALNTDGSATFAQMPVPPSPYAMRNKIINGAMEIDQRNGGASVTIGASTSTYTLDRWFAQSAQASKFSVQQNAGSVTPPTGFKNYFGVTSLAATTAGASETYAIIQAVEGLNVPDIAFGTAGAKTITVSFWVRSSLTGSFGASVASSAASRSYPFAYTISAANTWEYKTITIPGDVTGTWLTTTGVGLYLICDMGSGSNYKGTANTWASAAYYGATGTQAVVGTNCATWYVTGVQLEIGSVATPFERRLYNQELAMCQRYYEVDDIPASGSPKISSSGLAQGTTHYLAMFKVSKRTTPTVAMTYISNIDNSTSAVGTTSISSGAFRGFNTINNGSFYYADAWVRYAAAAEL